MLEAESRDYLRPLYPRSFQRPTRLMIGLNGSRDVPEDAKLVLQPSYKRLTSGSLRLG
jgi:hypothetical protein